MNILLLIDGLSHGGAETHLVTLALALAARGHRVSVLSDGGALQDKLILSGIACLRPPCPFGSRSAVGFVRNVFFLRRLQRDHRYDVLHAHTRRTALLLRFLKRSTLSARIVSCHARFSSRFRRLSFWGERTVAVSEDLAHHLRRVFGVPRERVEVIPNGIDAAQFCPADTKSGDERLHIVFASRLDSDCSSAAFALVSLLPRLCRKYKLALTVVGGGDQYETLTRVAKEVNAAAGEQLVQLTGALSDLTPQLQAADVFVGVSRAALEALFCGACVILAGNEGFGGVLTRENYEHFAQGNFCCRGEGKLSESALETALLSLLDMSRDDRQRSARDLRGVLEARYSAKPMAEATERVYADVLEQKRPRRLLIGGYAGCGNLGDDAILRSLVARLRREDASISLCATVGSPVASRASFEGIGLVGRHAPLALWRAMGRADAFILGGGCLLQNCSAHGNRSLLYYLSLLWLARLRRRPACLVANGIGPLNGRLPRVLVARTLRQAASISVRDERSRALLVSLGLCPDGIDVVPDPVLSLCPADQAGAARFLGAHLPPQAAGERYICVCPRPSEGGERALIRALDLLWKNERLYPLFFAFDQKTDVPLCEHMIAACGVGHLLPTDDERLVAAVFAHARVGAVIARRLHPLILSCVAGKAAVALDYSSCDGKLGAFSCLVGQLILPSGAAAEDIVCAVKEIFNRQDE